MLGCKNIIVIFVKYRKVSTHTILPNFIDLSIETALYLRFGGGMGQREKEEAYIEEAYVRQVLQVLSCFNSTPLATQQNNSPVQPK
jgi:hypothetical protein